MVSMVRVILDVVEEEAGAPLASSFVSHVRIQAPRADPVFEFVSAQCPVSGKTPIRIEQIPAAAEQDLTAPIKSLELIVLQRNIAQLQIDANNTAFLLRQRHPAGTGERIKT